VKKLLFISYYFPPLGMGGVQRAAKFARYLPEFGWMPYVVTVKPIRYYAYDETLLHEIQHVPVFRTGSLDPARMAHLLSKLLGERRKRRTDQAFVAPQVRSFARWQARVFVPDSKILWLPFAWWQIRRLLAREHFDAVFSTSPPISAHFLAEKIHLPWIADFRDYWSYGDRIDALPARHRKAYQSAMTRIAQRAQRIITVSQPIADAIRPFGPQNSAVHVIYNGFDPDDFADVSPVSFDRFTFVYTGNLNERWDLQSFFQAVLDFWKEQPEWRGRMEFVFVGRHVIGLPNIPHQLVPYVEFVDYVPHRQSIAYLKGAGALLFLLAEDSAPGMVTGKVFEYLASGKPILGIVPEHTEAFRILRRQPGCYLAQPGNVEDIRQALRNLLEASRDHPVAAGWKRDLSHFNRKEQAGELARLLEESVREFRETHQKFLN